MPRVANCKFITVSTSFCLAVSRRYWRFWYLCRWTPFMFFLLCQATHYPVRIFCNGVLVVFFLQSMVLWSSNTVWYPCPKVVCGRFQRSLFFVTEDGFCFALYCQGLRCTCSEAVLVHFRLHNYRTSAFFELFCCVGVYWLRDHLVYTARRYLTWVS